MDLLGLPLRRLTIVLVVAAACGAPEAEPSFLDRGLRYLDDPAYRMAALEASIVDPTNGYSQRRLERYADWDSLDEWRPRVAIATDGTPPTEGWFEIDVDVVRTEAALLELGARAFAAYPVQIRPELARALEGPDDYGLISGSAVWVDLRDGPTPAVTCATCHSTADIIGAPNHAFDLGRLVDDFFGAYTDNRTWGPGRIDVTGDGVLNPTAITDLRPIAEVSHLHRAATLRNDPIALAIRIETLMITSVSETQRPPRIIALALAMYLWKMRDGLPPWQTNRVYLETCAGCHGVDGRPTAPRSIEEIGTHDAVAQSPERGTGRWRVPSLRGVSGRGRLFSDGAIDGLDALLDPARTVPGHRFGLDRSAADRAALRELLESL